nr:AAA family ATPase [Pseudomonas sp. 21LCFQ02]
MAPLAIAVKEKGVRCFVNQGGLSQGMYRALAILVQFYANILWARHACGGRQLQLGDSPLILIDDIGEGLDHERARKMIGLLVSESLKYNIQIIMSSNDRYVMNYVPLENWTVLSRNGSKVSSINYNNSKDVFDEFSYSGLSNFDFFSGGHYVKEDV